MTFIQLGDITQPIFRYLVTNDTAWERAYKPETNAQLGFRQGEVNGLLFLFVRDFEGKGKIFTFYPNTTQTAYNGMSGSFNKNDNDDTAEAAAGRIRRDMQHAGDIGINGSPRAIVPIGAEEQFRYIAEVLGYMPRRLQGV